MQPLCGPHTTPGKTSRAPAGPPATRYDDTSWPGGAIRARGRERHVAARRSRVHHSAGQTGRPDQPRPRPHRTAPHRRPPPHPLLQRCPWIATLLLEQSTGLVTHVRRLNETRSPPHDCTERIFLALSRPPKNGACLNQRDAGNHDGWGCPYLLCGGGGCAGPGSQLWWCSYRPTSGQPTQADSLCAMATLCRLTDLGATDHFSAQRWARVKVAKNGGVLKRRRFPTQFATSWAADHFER